jgi:hypothetical protein
LHQNRAEDHLGDGGRRQANPPRHLCDEVSRHAAGSPAESKRREDMKKLIDLLRPDLNEVDTAEVKRLLPDVMRDGPQTNRAVVRFQTILAKTGKATYDVAIKIISDIASETAKKLLGLKP